MIKKQKIPIDLYATDLSIEIDDLDQHSSRGSPYRRQILEGQQKELEAQLQLQKVKEPAHFTRKYLERIQIQIQREKSSKTLLFEHQKTANRKPKTQDSKNQPKYQSMTNLHYETPPEISIDSNSDKFKTERIYLDIIKIYHSKVLELPSIIQESRKQKNSYISAQRNFFNKQRQIWQCQRGSFNQQRQDWRKQRKQLKAESFKDKFQHSYRIRTLKRQNQGSRIITRFYANNVSCCDSKENYKPQAQNLQMKIKRDHKVRRASKPYTITF